MQYAQLSGIDGFALNMGTDSWEYDQIALAYQAANQLSDFWVFISFDMSSYTWDPSNVASLISNYKGNSAQYTVNGLPFVSTFEGTDFAESGYWNTVRNSVGIYLVPDWSSLGSYAIQSAGLLSQVDGLREYRFYATSSCSLRPKANIKPPPQSVGTPGRPPALPR
jgi:hypothetical protein